LAPGKRNLVLIGALAVVGVLVAAGSVFVVLRNGGPANSSKIIGTWKWNGDDINVVRTFTSDNKWSGSVTLKVTINEVRLAANPVAEDGVWSLDGNKLACTLKHIATEIKTVGTVDTYTIVRLDDSTMVMQSVDGTATWERVP
jgi:hypothetical protein